MVVYAALIWLPLLKLVSGDDRFLLNPGKSCVATATQVGVCHVCVCKTDGVYYCRDSQCDFTRTNATHALKSLPEIREGEPCTPGRMYKLECNTCKCSANRALMCTKMACIDWRNYNKKMHSGKKALRGGDGGAKMKPFLPQVQKGITCKPGKLYMSKCAKCFCTDENKILCSKKLKDACVLDKQGNPLPVQTPEDVRPPPQSADMQNLPILASASQMCKAGKSYKVDCNFCLCLENGNLLCQRKLCISYDDMNRMQALEMSGKSCTSNGEAILENCQNCECIDGKMHCEPVPDCSPPLLNLAGPVPQDLDPGQVKGKCVPSAIYKVNCNKCYCQADGSLRCTQKTCLNYTQVKLLEKQRAYLEKHGL